LETKLTLYRGQREIELLYLGRGNTRGDLVVYLPNEEVLMTGDLLVSPIPCSFGSYLGDRVQTLKRLREIDAEIIIPGHGQPQRNKDYPDFATSLLESVVNQTKDAVKRGLSLEEARKTVDLESFRRRIAGDDLIQNLAFTSFFVTPAVERAYKEARGELD
jgi:cyclase